MATKSGYKNFISRNNFEFNNSCELASNKSHYEFSVFTKIAIQDVALGYFNHALTNIENNTKTPLCDLFQTSGSDKSTWHNYSQIYYQLLSPFLNDAFNFVEIGIGTPSQDVPSKMHVNYIPGSSLRGWDQLFKNTNTKIFAGDIDPRALFDHPRIQTAYVNQLNPKSILNFLSKNDLLSVGIDFFLDDGLHEFRSNATLLISVWPYIKNGGLYLIEDIGEKVFHELINFISSLALNASVHCFELPGMPDDNRIICLQKLS